MVKINFEFTVKFNIGRKRFGAKANFGKRSVADIFLEEISQIGDLRSIKTKDNYATATRSFANYAGCDYPMSKFDSNILECYERWLKNRGITLNTISCYMRSLRSLYNMASKRYGIADDKIFNGVFTGMTKTRKRSVQIEDIKKLMRLTLSDNSFDSLARDVFVFSFYALGMPFVDVSHLTHENIHAGYISYCRRKTGQQIRIPIEPCILEIINKYHTEERKRIFPLIPDDENQQTELAYRKVLCKYNKALIHLAQMAKTSGTLTSYVVRHTWASLAYSSNVELSVISKALGHANTKTTLVYIREIDDKQVADANRMIINSVSGT